MKIAFLIINYNRREGTSKAVAEVAERLAGRHEVHVFSRSWETEPCRSVRHHCVAGVRYPHVAEFLSYVWSCASALRPDEFDIVHAAGALCAEANVYTIQNIQPAKEAILKKLEGTERVSLLRKLSRRAYLKATTAFERRCYQRKRGHHPLFLPVSTGVAEELQSFYQVLDGDLAIIPNAADTETFKPMLKPDKDAWRAKEGLHPADVLAAFCGGEWMRKGLDLAIEGLAILNQSHVKLVVFGKDDAQPQFEAMALKLGVARQVHFAGHRRDVNEGLAACDLFLFPSRYEAFSLATLEAAACGLPLVATRINGTEDLIIPGDNGEFVQPDPLDIAKTLAAFVQSSALRERMGVAARARVLDHYTWDRVAAMTEKAYEKHLHRISTP